MVVRILVVDDHPLTRDALASLLGQGGFEVVGEAADGAEALELAERLHPDIVLLDLSMPVLDGLEVLPRLRAACATCEVVVLTASGTEENLLAAIRGGAAGYLLKSEPPERIVAFLHGVANGEAALSGEVARRLLEQVRLGGRRSAACPTTSQTPSRRARSRCCCSWTTTSRLTPSPSASTSRSTPCART